MTGFADMFTTGISAAFLDCLNFSLVSLLFPLNMFAGTFGFLDAARMPTLKALCYE